MRIGLSASRAAIAVALLLASGATVACERTVAYQMREPISMGPYTFVVEDARLGAWGSDLTIDIELRVTRDDAAPFTTSFESYVGDRMQIVDEAGNVLWADATPVLPVYRAGRWHAERYLARVRLLPDMVGVRDRARLGSRPADFRLTVRNQAPERDQPRRVMVRLK